MFILLLVIELIIINKTHEFSILCFFLIERTDKLFIIEKINTLKKFVRES